MYGQAFSLDNPSENGLNAPAGQKGQAGEFTRAAGFLAYYEICYKIKYQGYQVVTDPQGRMGPYAVKGRQWVGYDDVNMIRYKVSMTLDYAYISCLLLHMSMKQRNEFIFQL